MIDMNSRQAVTFHTNSFILSLLQLLLGQLQVEVELPLLLFKFGKLRNESTRFLQKIKDMSIDKIKDYLLLSE